MILLKSFVSSRSHKRALASAAKRIRAELDRRATKPRKPLTLDSAHLEQAFDHHLRLYDDDGLLRMGMLLRSSGQGSVSDDDARLLNRLPFYIIHPTPSSQDLDMKDSKGRTITPLPSLFMKIKRYLDLSYSPLLHNSLQRLKAQLDKPADTSEEFLHILRRLQARMSGRQKLILDAKDRINGGKLSDEEKNKEYEHIDRNQAALNEEGRLAEEVHKLSRKRFEDFIHGLSQLEYTHYAPILYNHNTNETETRKASDFLANLGVGGFDRVSIEKNHQQQKQIIEEINELQKRGEEYAKKFPIIKKFADYFHKFRAEREYHHASDAQGYNPDVRNNPYLPLEYKKFLRSIDFWGTQKDEEYPEERVVSSYGVYNPTRPNLLSGSGIMNWVQRFAPARYQYGRRPKMYLYHGSKLKFPFWDPKYFKVHTQNYGIGLYNNKYNIVPFDFTSGDPWMTRMFVPQHFKFLSNEKSYRGTRLLKDVDKYFSDLAQKMNRPDLKNEFINTLKDSVATMYREAFGQGSMRVRRKEIEKLNDPFALEMYQRALQNGGEFSPRNAMPGATWCYATKRYKDLTEFDLQRVNDERSDLRLVDSGKIPPHKIPGSILHRAIKLTFEKFGANPATHVVRPVTHVFVDNDEPAQAHIRTGHAPQATHQETYSDDPNYAYPTAMRNSTYHTTVLLSSLGYHGYVHNDPESDIARSRHGHILSTGQQQNLRSVVMFPSALADVPFTEWRKKVSTHSMKTYRPPKMRGPKGRFEAGAMPLGIEYTPEDPLLHPKDIGKQR